MQQFILKNTSIPLNVYLQDHNILVFVLCLKSSHTAVYLLVITLLPTRFLNDIQRYCMIP